ncbi:MAG: histidine--tRNA ligase [Alphaproteobacteria bacterium]|nr:histidine--tRNA ligase [Alphaproteobacteria bacterium]
MNESEAFRPEARQPRGFRDRFAGEVAREREMIAALSALAERYGFAPLATPALEYADALGKFLPDEDRPNEGVFAFQDDDEAWLSLRYDHTAPLARLVAQGEAPPARPLRRYAAGPVWRNEKPGPGRFREFLQFDVDTVGSEAMAADAELIAFLAEGLEAVGVPQDGFVVNLSHRKLVAGIMDAAGIPAGEDAAIRAQRLRVLRSIDKLDRLGIEGVRLLLGPGRRDESGDVTPGAGLKDSQIASIEASLGATVAFDAGGELGRTPAGREALADLEEIRLALAALGIGAERVRVTPSVVRGIEYYTGPVFEAELTHEIRGPDGAPMRFGSVASGGRYDDLVMRFTGERVPATGASVGVSRLISALTKAGEAAGAEGPVLVLAMDRAMTADYLAMVAELRGAGIPAELYLGRAGMKAQLKYADRRGSPVAVIQGGDERAKGEVTLKDLKLGAEMARSIEDNRAWREGRPAQETAARGTLVASVRAILARQREGRAP